MVGEVSVPSPIARRDCYQFVDRSTRELSALIAYDRIDSWECLSCREVGGPFHRRSTLRAHMSDEHGIDTKKLGKLCLSPDDAEKALRRDVARSQRFVVKARRLLIQRAIPETNKDAGEWLCAATKSLPRDLLMLIIELAFAAEPPQYLYVS